MKTLAPAVATIAPLLPPTPKGEAARSASRLRLSPWRQWYHTARWQRLRWRVLDRDGFRCQMCGTLHHDASRLTCDHKEPHRGNADLFWSEANCQALCTDPCHNSRKQAEETARW